MSKDPIVIVSAARTPMGEAFHLGCFFKHRRQ